MHEHDGTLTSGDGTTTIFHRSWLPDDEPRSAVLLVHGLGEHSGRYEHVASALVEAGHAVYALDHRGHGRSSGRRAYVRRYEELADDLVMFRRHVEVEQPDVPLFVLGHSMGGNLAVDHVLDHQDGVAGLVLSGPALQVGDAIPPLQLKVFKVLGRVAPGLKPQGLDADAISRDPDVVAAYRSDPLVYTGKIPAGLGAALISRMETFPARYKELTVPVLVMHGTDDRLADIGGSRTLEAGAVNAPVTAHYYEGLFHEVFNEPERERVLGDLVAWIDGVLAR